MFRELAYKWSRDSAQGKGKLGGETEKEQGWH